MIEFSNDIKVRLFNNPETVSAGELEGLLAMIPEWRRRKVLSYRFLIDRVLCAKAYLLLCEELRETYNITELQPFGFEENGKPILSYHPDIHFNLSHCRKGVLCACSDKPIGCDIEEIPLQLDLDLCHHVFSEKENEEILASTNPCVSFAILWTKKEAYLKLTGEGINDNLPSLFNPTILSKIEFYSNVCQDNGYVYTVCNKL